MDFQSHAEPVTPAPYENGSFWRTEDSGYHTSFTPGSMECSEISTENLDPTLTGSNGNTQIVAEGNFRIGRKYRRNPKGTPASSHYDSYLESPPKRRGVKRSYEEDKDFILSPVPTPSSIIAGGLQRLKVNESGISPVTSSFSESVCSHLYSLESSSYTLSYPTTPVKKFCRSGTAKLSPSNFNDSHKSSPLRAIDNLSCPPRRSAKKLNFANHSLSGETQSVIKPKTHSKVVRTIFRPEQRIDIIKMLYHKVCTMPAINKILSYLSNEDIYNFSLVSPAWLEICEDNAKSKKNEYVAFITNTKENHENRNKCTNELSIKSLDHTKVSGGSLKDIHNIVNICSVKNPITLSPPISPKTRKFKTFTKSASLDSRIQMSCVRCCHPAKVTEEKSGEEWVECTSISCSYKFCRFCKCERHPNKICFQYDLEGPSPSKRKKKSSAVGTKKSKRNLRRLLD